MEMKKKIKLPNPFKVFFHVPALRIPFKTLLINFTLQQDSSLFATLSNILPLPPISLPTKQREKVSKLSFEKLCQLGR
jgi:hypothetical protein